MLPIEAVVDVIKFRIDLMLKESPRKNFGIMIEDMGVTRAVLDAVSRRYEAEGVKAFVDGPLFRVEPT